MTDIAFSTELKKVKHSVIHVTDTPQENKKVIKNVSLTGTYQFPKNFYLVSPVLWVQSEASQPINIEIDHCSRSENTSKLNFVRTEDARQMKPPYRFKILEGGSFPSDSHHGVISLKLASDVLGLAIAQEGSDEREYCAMVYSIYQGIANYKFDVVMTWNTKSHRSVSDILQLHC